MRFWVRISMTWYNCWHVDFLIRVLSLIAPHCRLRIQPRHCLNVTTFLRHPYPTCDLFLITAATMYNLGLAYIHLHTPQPQLRSAYHMASTTYISESHKHRKHPRTTHIYIYIQPPICLLSAYSTSLASLLSSCGLPPLFTKAEPSTITFHSHFTLSHTSTWLPAVTTSATSPPRSAPRRNTSGQSPQPSPRFWDHYGRRHRHRVNLLHQHPHTSSSWYVYFILLY